MTEKRDAAAFPGRNMVKRGGWAIVVSLGLSACAGTPVGGGSAADRQDAVAKIAQTRWDALIKRDFDAAYGLTSPASRSTVTLEVFRRKAGLVKWKSAIVEKVDCAAEDVCTARVTAIYTYRLRAMGRERDVENTQVLDEIWRNTEGSWWYVLSDSM